MRDADGKFTNPFDAGLAENCRVFLGVVENEAEIQRRAVMSAREMEGILGSAGGKGSDTMV